MSWGTEIEEIRFKIHTMMYRINGTIKPDTIAAWRFLDEMCKRLEHGEKPAAVLEYAERMLRMPPSPPRIPHIPTNDERAFRLVGEILPMDGISFERTGMMTQSLVDAPWRIVQILSGLKVSPETAVTIMLIAIESTYRTPGDIKFLREMELRKGEPKEVHDAAKKRRELFEQPLRPPLSKPPRAGKDRHKATVKC